MPISAEEIAALAVAAIQNAGLGGNAETFNENPFADDINPGTKNGLPLFNAATPVVPNDK
eukprot:15223421-Ditylum_brightwellii.AAC.1